MITILKVLVGSRAHRLNTEKSDFDYRGVFVTPTSELLRLGSKTDQTSWNEDKVDDVSWEVGKFLFMATKCNPIVLEAFLAPIEDVDIDDEGIKLRKLFPLVWNSVGVRDAYIGYGLNQRKKFLENKDVRPAKYACAYLRSLYNATELLKTGTFSVDMSKTPIYETLKKWKSGEYTFGEVIQVTHDAEMDVRAAFEENPDKETDMRAVNDYLLRVRKENWT